MLEIFITEKVLQKKLNENQRDLLVQILNFKTKAKQKSPEKKQQNEDVFKNLYNLLECRKRVLNAFDSKIFPTKIEDKRFSGKVSNHSNTKILTPKQMLERLPIALTQVKAGNTSKNFLNEIRQLKYSLYRPKEITKKVYNNIINSIKV